MPSRYSYSQLLDANVLARKGGDSFYWQCTTRTVQESKLFPVNPYIAMSYLNAWYRWPEFMLDMTDRLGLEGVAELGEELLRRFRLVLDVDADHHDAAVAVHLPGARERGRLLVAGRVAP